MREKRTLRIISGLGGAAAIVALTPSIGFAQEGPGTQAILDNIWVFIAGALVFFMQAGFALVEAGLAQRVVELVSLARKAGLAVAGFEKVKDWLAGGRARVLLQAGAAVDDVAARHAEVVREQRRRLPDLLVREVPAGDTDIHDLAGLRQVAAWL